MKNYIILILLTTSFFLPQKVIYAAIPISTINPTVAVGRNELQIQTQDKSTASSNLSTSTLPSVKLFPQEKITKLIGKIGEYAERIEKINQKIGTRIEKLKKNKVKTASLVSQYSNLTRQIKILNTEIKKLNNLLTDFGQSGNQKSDYPQLKKQLTNVSEKLKEIIALQKELAAEMGKYDIISITPTGNIVKGNE